MVIGLVVALVYINLNEIFSQVKKVRVRQREKNKRERERERKSENKTLSQGDNRYVCTKNTSPEIQGLAYIDRVPYFCY